MRFPSRPSHLVLALALLPALAAAETALAPVSVTAKGYAAADVETPAAMPADIRGPLMAKLPLEFKRLGFSVHEDLDVLALDAEALGDREHTLRQLAALMGKCVACHAAWTVLPPEQGANMP